MKLYLLSFFLLIATGYTYAQNTLPGYYINQKNDSIPVQIKISKGVFGQIKNEFVKEVEVIDSLAVSKTFTPDDIKSYGFLHNGLRYRFYSKPVQDGSRKFLSPVVVGSKYSLYQYGNFTSGGGSALASSKTYYTFEKADGTYLSLRDILNNKFRTQVREFFKDSPEVQQLIDTKLKYWLELRKDLREILLAANK